VVRFARLIQAPRPLRPDPVHLERAYPEATCESDRAIRAHWHGSGARVHLADGGLHFPDGEAVGIELERYTKKLGRYQGAVADADPACRRCSGSPRSAGSRC
jgi:hypothetical protein